MSHLFSIIKSNARKISVVKSFLLLSVSFGSTNLMSGSVAKAQDLLPRDNGISSYHKSPRWRESESHPLRIIAYALHPVGWLAREGVFRPLSSFAASTEVTRSVMGYREPFDFREPVCFSASDEVPDCRSVLPWTGLSKGPGDGDGFGMSGDRQVFFPDVNFDFDKATLNDLGQGRVRQIAELLKTVPDIDIVVEGHTDYKGSDDYNMKLGERRAKAVISELVSLGIPESRLSPVSYGEGRPIFTEETDWARAVNRRSQFTVQGAGEINSERLPESTTLPPAAR
ncbi:MAG TPA: OmpA family protein [Oligoflexia bacterium]|nr:OmpA family protein [Oligoflexia bacterium]HMP47235.1 OmpA family protein [Oligoflexia bacterium]